MKFEKRYKDSELWGEISEELVLTFLEQCYADPVALLEEMEESARKNSPKPSYTINAPYAIYRAVMEDHPHQIKV